MKTAVIIRSILCVVLFDSLYLNHHKARTQHAGTTAQRENLTNELKQVETDYSKPSVT